MPEWLNSWRTPTAAAVLLRNQQTVSSYLATVNSVQLWTLPCVTPLSWTFKPDRDSVFSNLTSKTRPKPFLLPYVSNYFINAQFEIGKPVHCLNNLTENLTIILIFLFSNWFKINRNYIDQVIRLAMVSMVVALGQATSYGCSFLRFNSQTCFLFLFIRDLLLRDQPFIKDYITNITCYIVFAFIQ